MNKKIIAMAVAGAFALPMAAQADVKVYGAAQVEIGLWGGDAEGQSLDDNARGRIGIKGSEDLGGGLKGIYKFEFKADTSDGGSKTAVDKNGDSIGVALTGRELFVGLKGSWGQFEGGTLRSAYKYTGGVKYDQYTASIIEARGNGGMTGGYLGHNSFIPDSVGYQGKFGITSVRVTYDVDNGGGETTGSVSANRRNNVLSAGVKVGKKNWNVTAAYLNEGAKADLNGGDSESYSTAKIGGSFTFAGAHTIRGQYEVYSTEISGSDKGDGTTAYINYIFKFGKNNIDLAYGINDVKDDRPAASAQDFDNTFARIAIRHRFSKQTSTWLGYRMYDTDRTATTTLKPVNDYSVISLGIRKDF